VIVTFFVVFLLAFALADVNVDAGDTSVNVGTDAADVNVDAGEDGVTVDVRTAGGSYSYAATGVRTFNREDLEAAREEMRQARAQVREGAMGIRESYKGEIDVLRQQYREDRAAMAEEAADLIKELANADLTEEERAEIRAELKVLRDEHRAAVGAYVDEAKGIHVEYQTELKEYLAGAEIDFEMSNGRSVEIKVMPEVAAQRALERLRMRTCDENNECKIELKEVGSGENVRVAYSVQAQRQGRFLGIFAMNMDVESEVDAETGDVVRTRKPWFAFLVSEPVE